MPIYVYRCEKCRKKEESYRGMESANPICCETPMTKVPTFPAVTRVEGQYPSRKKWMDSWTPDSPPFQIGSLHGEKY